MILPLRGLTRSLRRSRKKLIGGATAAELLTSPLYRYFPDSSWGFICGNTDNEFAQAVEDNYEGAEILSVVDPIRNVNIDLTHLAASTGAILYETSNQDLIDRLEPTYGSLLPGIGIFLIPQSVDIADGILNIMAGWGGDLCSVGVSAEEQYPANTTMPSNISDILKGAIGSSTTAFPNAIENGTNPFSWNDLCEDVDAFNMASRLNTYRIDNAFATYYQYDAKKRFSGFIETWGGVNELYDTADLITASTDIYGTLMNKVRQMEDGTNMNASRWGTLLRDAFMAKIQELAD